MANVDYEQLLQELSRLPGYAEQVDPSEFAKSFHVIPAHLKAFDPNVVLILGGRGSGKSYLFRAVTEQNLAADLARLVPEARIPAAAKWIEGFSNSGKGRPDANSLATSLRKSPLIAQDYWLASLVRSLQHHLQESEREKLNDLIHYPGAALSDWLSFAEQHRETLTECLDALDTRLAESNQTIFIGYDELDTLIDQNPERSGEALQGLIAFWARFHRRWGNIRPKLFLRTDLFRRFATQGGADLAKLSANRVEIRWDDLHLQGVLFKQIMNLPDPSWESRLGLKRIKDDTKFGKLLQFKTSKDYQAAYSFLIGKYMGEGPRKGLSERWLVEHVRDGNGQAHPRAMVHLVAKAADLQIAKGLPTKQKGQTQTLLHPSSVRNALTQISIQHVKDMNDAWPWLIGFIEMTSAKQTPVEDSQWIHWIKGAWDSWQEKPHISPNQFLEELLEIGVLRRRSDRKIDASDLYLDGLKLLRKGGVKRD